jgi:hypothetical protein
MQFATANPKYYINIIKLSKLQNPYLILVPLYRRLFYKEGIGKYIYKGYIKDLYKFGKIIVNLCSLIDLKNISFLNIDLKLSYFLIDYYLIILGNSREFLKTSYKIREDLIFLYSTKIF